MIYRHYGDHYAITSAILSFPCKAGGRDSCKAHYLDRLRFFIAFWAFLGALFAPIPASAEEVYILLDGTSIEEDLAGMDTSVYPADVTGTARLLDDRGFFEYAYSEDSFLAENYYGAYMTGFVTFPRIFRRSFLGAVRADGVIARF